jgi:hypothetical protein
MDQITLPKDLSRRLSEIARRENRPVEEVVEAMIRRYEPASPPPDPDESLREFRRKLYRIARDYWREVGDEQRLALTDEQLDEQFWLIDHEGIPRLKEDQGKVQIPPNPFEGLIGIIKDGPPDLSTSVRETLEEYFRSKDNESK